MKIGVVGLGLIGGSIFKELRSLEKYELIGVSSSVKDTTITVTTHLPHKHNDNYTKLKILLQLKSGATVHRCAC